MKTSLNDIRKIEGYLSGNLEHEEEIAFHAKLCTDPMTRMNVILHQKMHDILRAYHRKKLRQEIERTHQRIFCDPEKVSFTDTIVRLFNN